MKKIYLTIVCLIGAFMGMHAEDHPGCYNRISMSYRNVNFSAHGASAGYNGGSFNYLHGFGISSSLPMYIETGGSLSFTTKDTGSGAYGGYATIEVPVNFAYRLAFANDKLAFIPSLGLNFKGNIIGTSDIATNTQSWYDESDYKRFQLGWQITAGLEYRRLYVGLSYGTDFIQIAKKVNTGTFAFTLGLKI